MVKPALLGLQAELADPLGTDRKRRGVDAYNEAQRARDPNYMSGPLADPQWAGMFQAMADNGVSKVAMDGARPHGIADDPTQPGWAPPPVDTSALTAEDLLTQRRMATNNIAGAPQSLMGLRRASQKVR